MWFLAPFSTFSDHGITPMDRHPYPKDKPTYGSAYLELSLRNLAVSINAQFSSMFT
uniref:Ganglioside induced differentiation associated protein n=1 Tax=Solanum tuberosum TaxID=4113 RepID=M1CQZ9_SOLTU